MVTSSTQKAVANALQSLVSECLDPGLKIRKLAEFYARGRMSLGDLSAAIAELDQQERLAI